MGKVFYLDIWLRVLVVEMIAVAKNSELKHSYHLDKAISYGLDAYTLQGAVALLTSYLVRINRILDEKAK